MVIIFLSTVTALTVVAATFFVDAQSVLPASIPFRDFKPAAKHSMCRSYECHVPAIVDASFALSIDPSLCADPTAPCEPCLAGPYGRGGEANKTWADVLAAIGTWGPARRKPYHVIYDNWLSSVLSTEIFHIILREAMNVPVVPVPYSYWYEDLLCCDQSLISVEAWGDSTSYDEEAQLLMRRLPLGYEGMSNLYVARFVAERYPLLATYHSLHIRDYVSIFPRAFSTPCEYLLQNESLGCVDGNYLCDQSTAWNFTRCDHGRFVPPQCDAARGGDPSYCGEIIHADPAWDTGFFEGLVKNLNLNFTVAYVGVNRLPDFVSNATARNESQIFYWYEPDALPSRLQAQAIQFSRPSRECLRAWSNDPYLSNATCGYAPKLINKIARQDDLLLRDPTGDVSFFFSSFQLDRVDISTILSQHVSAGGNLTGRQVACAWVKENYPAWKDWIRNTPPPVRNDAAGMPAWAIAVLCIALSVVTIAVGLLVVLYVKHQSNTRDNRLAPSDPYAPVAIVFTDIQSSTMLWAQLPENMAVALDTHHELIRREIVTHRGYEVKTIGDSFMVALKSADDAVSLAIGIQEALFRHQWETKNIDLQYQAAMEESGGGGKPGGQKDGDYDKLWSGLRVRVGVHFAMVSIKLDEVTKGYDYYGDGVNTAARVESVAHGGQVVITAEALNALSPDFRSRTSSELIFTDHGLQPLRGLDQPMRLWQVASASLKGRQFPPLRIEEDDGGAAGGGQDGTGSLLHELASQGRGSASPDASATSSRTSGATGPLLSGSALHAWTLMSPLKLSDRIAIAKQLCKGWRVPWRETEKPSGGTAAAVAQQLLLRRNLRELGAKGDRVLAAQHQQQPSLQSSVVLTTTVPIASVDA